VDLHPSKTGATGDELLQLIVYHKGAAAANCPSQRMLDMMKIND